MATKTTGIKAGPLRYRVTIQRPEVVRDDANGEPVVDSWAKVATVWAAIEPLSAREYLASSEFRAGVTTRIRIRWRDDIDASMRVLHGSTIYAIDGVLPGYVGMSELQLMCGAGVVTAGGQP